MRRAHLARGLAALHRMGCRRVVLYAWRPEFVDWLDLVDADLVCYHVADEYSFEAVERPIDARERAMLERADQVFIHSPALMEKKGRINPHTAFVTNGVDYEAFATPRPEPEDLRPIRRPRLGYVGRIKTQLDWNVLEALARTHPDWSLVFVGPEGAPGPWRERWQALRTLPNVHWLGARTVDAIAPYVQHVDVGLLCYRVDAYTRYIYPLKLHEFLAAGVPVVGSDIPSLRRFDDTIAIAAGVEGWERSVRTALDDFLDRLRTRRSLAHARPGRRTPTRRTRPRLERDRRTHRVDPGLAHAPGPAPGVRRRSPQGGNPMTASERTAHPLEELGIPCRFCGEPLRDTFADLGMTPLCQNRIRREDLNRPETFYPLHAFVCRSCWLVQLAEYASPEAIFSDYAYFSSYADTWVEHARRYVEMVRERLGLGPQSLVVELASNDGYLLQWFVRAGVPVLGVEPAANVADVAREKGIRTVTRFFGTEAARELREEYGAADLLLGNNVLAHVPDLNDFVEGMKRMLAPDGVITMEFPHLLQLVEQNQFDTIYHEHFSYFSFTVVERVFAAHGITLFDVEELPTHGGSIRIWGRHADRATPPVAPRVRQMREREAAWGVTRLETYTGFAERIRRTKASILEFFIQARRQERRVVGYGAPGKGNTLLNDCGIGTDFLEFTVDRSPHKQGTFTPGTHIPILAPDAIDRARPDYVFILPWNLREEIMRQMVHVRRWGGRFVVPIPEVRVYD